MVDIKNIMESYLANTERIHNFKFSELENTKKNEMIDFITSIFYPEFHPIERLNLKHREEYVRGLGELLSFFMPNNQKAKFAFEVLCYKLSNITAKDIWCNEVYLKIPVNAIGIDEATFFKYLYKEYWEQINIKITGLNAFKKAISIKREGLIFFRMTKSFWWDFYRICKLAAFPIENRFNSYVLDQIICKSSRKYSTDVKNFFYANGNGAFLPSDLKQIIHKEKIFKDKGFIRILVVGTMSSGKSTLINALVGHKIVKTKTIVCTSTVSYICNRPVNDYIIYSDGDTCVASDHVEKSLGDSPIIALNFEGKLHEKPIILIDTPGINYAYDKRHKALTEKEISLANYDVIMGVVNSCYMESDESKALIDTIASVREKKKIFVLNQFDKFNPDDDSIAASINYFKFVLNELKIRAEVVPFSAKAAFLFKNIGKGDTLNIEKTEIIEYKKKMDTSFYDLGSYITGSPSNENDYNARTGLTYLENIILKK